MKKSIILFMFLLIATCGWAQKVWENPTSFFDYHHCEIKVSKVELLKKETIVHLNAKMHGHFPFGKETYLKTPDGKHYLFTGAKATCEDEIDYPTGYNPYADNTNFALHFEPLPKDVERFHLIEGDIPHAFRIWNITEGKPMDVSELFNSNWRDDQTGDWVLGLYADNAVYDNKLWKYEEKSDKNVVLTDGQDKTTINIGQYKNGKRQFAINGQEVTLSSFGSILPAYPTADNTAFSTEYKEGEAVITGWIKDFPKELSNNGINLTATVVNFLTNEPINTIVPVSDELGRFSLKVKLNGTQTVRFTETGEYDVFIRDIVLEPGKKYYMVHDWKNNNCLFMGEDARLQNELAANPCDIEKNPFWELHAHDKMMTEFKNKSLANYDKATSLLNDIIAKNPNISRRYRDYVNERNRIVAAAEIQDLMNDKNGTLTDEFASAISRLTAFNPAVPISLAPGFGQFQYLRIFSCQKEIKEKSGQTPEFYSSLEEKGMIKYSDSERDLLKRWQQREKFREDKRNAFQGQKYEAFMEELDRICKKSEILEFVDKENIKKVYDEWVLKPYGIECRAIDSLYCDQIMRDYSRANWLCHELVYTKNLREEASAVINEIKDDYFKQQVVSLKNYYAELTKQNEEAVKTVIATASNVEDLTDGKAIVEKMIEPYKGKIVYMDIWGTWCEACLVDIKASSKLKEALKDYDIVYLYFSYGSDETAWKGNIAELGLTKPNYVHYNLPRNQQKAVIAYLQVDVFPSYFLFDKQGNMEKLERGHTADVQGFKNKIDELSKK